MYQSPVGGGGAGAVLTGLELAGQCLDGDISLQASMYAFP